MSINDAYADLMNEVTTLKAMLEKTTSQAAAMREALEFWVRNPTMGRGLGDVPHEQWSKMEAMTTRALDITDAGRRLLREVEALREVAEAARGPGGDYTKAWERLYAALERLDKQKSVPENQSAFDPVAAERALKRADEVLGSFCAKCGAAIGAGRGQWMAEGRPFCSERCAKEATDGVSVAKLLEVEKERTTALHDRDEERKLASAEREANRVLRRRLAEVEAQLAERTFRWYEGGYEVRRVPVGSVTALKICAKCGKKIPHDETPWMSEGFDFCSERCMKKISEGVSVTRLLDVDRKYGELLNRLAERVPLPDRETSRVRWALRDRDKVMAMADAVEETSRSRQRALEEMTRERDEAKDGYQKFIRDVEVKIPQTYGDAIRIWPWLECQSHEWDSRTTAENVVWFINSFCARFMVQCDRLDVACSDNARLTSERDELRAEVARWRLETRVETPEEFEGANFVPESRALAAEARLAEVETERDARPLQSDWDHLVEDHASKCKYIEALVSQREQARLLLGGEKLSVEDALAGKRAATILELATKCRDERDEARRAFDEAAARAAEDQDEHSEQRADIVKRCEEAQERARTLEGQITVLREAAVKIATHTRPCEHSVACPGCIARDAVLAVSPWERGRGPALVDLRSAAEVLGRIFSLEDYRPHATPGTDPQCAGLNHGHQDFKTWDEDNKAGLAGRECKWCKAWRDAAEVLAKIKAAGVK